MKPSQVHVLFWSSLAACLLFVLPSLAHASVETRESAASVQNAKDLSQRSSKRLGAYLGVLGDPAPTLVGLNVAYNWTDYLRVAAGFGEVKANSLSYDGSTGTLSTEETGKLTTFGVGVRAMVPGWSLTPVAGLSLGYMKLSGSFTEVQGLTKSGMNAYGTVGLDYQASTGYNLAIGYNFPIGNSMESSPYINFGWFFDIGI